MVKAIKVQIVCICFTIQHHHHHHHHQQPHQRYPKHSVQDRLQVAREIPLQVQMIQQNPVCSYDYQYY